MPGFTEEVFAGDDDAVAAIAADAVDKLPEKLKRLRDEPWRSLAVANAPNEAMSRSLLHHRFRMPRTCYSIMPCWSWMRATRDPVRNLGEAI